MGQINIGSQRNQVALASATSANGTARTGASLPLNLAHPGSLSLQVTVTVVTGSVVATIKHFVSMDNSTFYEVHDTANAAYVTIAATAAVAITAPQQVSAWRYYRCTATLSGASTAAGDLTAVTMRYLTADDIFT